MRAEDIQPGQLVYVIGDPESHPNGDLVGTVVGLNGNHVELEESGGAHRWFPLDWAERSDDVAMYLDKTRDAFQAGSSTEAPVGG